MDIVIISSVIKENEYTNIKWTEKRNYKLPIQMFGFGHILYKHFLIIFGGRTKGNKDSDSIYLLDLNNSNKSFKLSTLITNKLTLISNSLF